MLDKILIQNLEIFAYHGVFAEEKKQGQTFYITIELDVDLRLAGISDDLTKTVHYGELCHEIKTEFTKTSYDLIECAAENIARYILNTKRLVQGVKISLKKPQAPIGLPLDYVAVEIYRCRHTAFIALGSSIGDREGYLARAITKIGDFSQVVAKSSVYRTMPEGGVAQNEFANAVIQIRTTLSADELLQQLQSIELAEGRVRNEHWGDRTLDLDIISYDDMVCDSQRLILPHPQMHKRIFVLQPLCEIAPYYLHIPTGLRAFELLKMLKNNDSKIAVPK